MITHDRLLEIVKSSMPRDARIDALPTSDDFRIGVRWLLGTDPSRPNKMSKTIVIVFAYESIADFENLSDSQQSEGCDRLNIHLRQFLDEFDPEHENRPDEPPPTETWNVGGLLISV